MVENPVSAVSIEALKVLCLSAIVWWIGSFVHEGAHWVFTVPFGGILEHWKWMPPGWVDPIFAPNPWELVAKWAGGLAAALFEYLLLVFVLLILVLRAVQGKRYTLWWYLGGSLAVIIPIELLLGVFEGRFYHLYTDSVWQIRFLVPVGIGLGIAGNLLWREAVPKHPQNSPNAKHDHTQGRKPSPHLGAGAVLEGLGQVRGTDGLGAGEVGDGPGQL